MRSSVKRSLYGLVIRGFVILLGCDVCFPIYGSARGGGTCRYFLVCVDVAGYVPDFSELGKLGGGGNCDRPFAGWVEDKDSGRCVLWGGM